MAANHIYFDDQTKYGRMLRRALSMLEEGYDGFVDIRDAMIQMRDGDGSDASHYAGLLTRFGFATNADAKAAFDELDSFFSKVSGNGSVSNVRAAWDQANAKLR